MLPAKFESLVESEKKAATESGRSKLNAIQDASQTRFKIWITFESHPESVLNRQLWPSLMIWFNTAISPCGIRHTADTDRRNAEIEILPYSSRQR